MSSSPEDKIVKTVKGKDIQYGFPKGTIVTTHHCTQVMREKIKVVYFFRVFFVLFLKIQLENINTKHFRCKKCDAFNGQCVKTKF